MKSIRLSIVIPTYNRLDALQRTLLSLYQQNLPADQYEIILVDDGSKDDIADLVNQHVNNNTILLLRQTNLGPAAARNRGANHASGEVILFLDNDMLASPNLLEEHLKIHNQKQIKEEPGYLVAGPRNRSRKGETDPLDWLDYRPDGSDLRLDKQPVTFQEMLTCNLSILRNDWKKLNGFREELTSFEYIEFAYRAWQIGMTLKFNCQALAYHNHPLSFDERMKRVGDYTQTVPLLYKIHPELRGDIIHLLDKEPIDWKDDSILLIMRKIFRSLLSTRLILGFTTWILRSLVSRKGTNKLVKFLYWKVVGSYQWIGFREGIRKYGWIN